MAKTSTQDKVKVRVLKTHAVKLARDFKSSEDGGDRAWRYGVELADILIEISELEDWS